MLRTASHRSPLEEVPLEICWVTVRTPMLVADVSEAPRPGAQQTGLPPLPPPLPGLRFSEQQCPSDVRCQACILARMHSVTMNAFWCSQFAAQALRCGPACIVAAARTEQDVQEEHQRVIYPPTVRQGWQGAAAQRAQGGFPAFLPAPLPAPLQEGRAVAQSCSVVWTPALLLLHARCRAARSISLSRSRPSPQ